MGPMHRNQDFVSTKIGLYYLPFLRLRNEAIQCVLARFFYIHHDMRLREINSAIAEQGCTLATEEDLASFFRLYENALKKLGNEGMPIIATHPQSLSEEVITYGNSKQPAIKNLVVPVILGTPSPVLSKMSLLGDFVIGHQNLVIGIEN
ncbi:MAG TPA: hypothetical protein VJH71_01295 [Candidatus Paceibacterota bacterium]